MMRVQSRSWVRVSSVVMIVSLLFGNRAQARGSLANLFPETAAPSRQTTTPGAGPSPQAASPKPLTSPAANASPYLSEVSPVSAPDNPAWLEIGLPINRVYLPAVMSGLTGGLGLQAVDTGVSRSTAASLPGVALNGWQISDEDANDYTIPAALPPLPPGAKLVLVFDGLGPAADDYDFSDGVATLHSPPGMTGIFDAAGDQVSLYHGSAHSAGTIADFVSWGQPAGADEANAVSAGLWTSGAFLSFERASARAALPAPTSRVSRLGCGIT